MEMVRSFDGPRTWKEMIFSVCKPTLYTLFSLDTILHFITKGSGEIIFYLGMGDS